MVASLDLSSGGAQCRQMPWHAGYVTPYHHTTPTSPTQYSVDRQSTAIKTDENCCKIVYCRAVITRSITTSCCNRLVVKWRIASAFWRIRLIIWTAAPPNVPLSVGIRAPPMVPWAPRVHASNHRCKKTFLRFLFRLLFTFLTFFYFPNVCHLYKTLAKFRAAGRLTRSTFKITATK